MDAVQYGVTIQIKPLWQNFCMVQLNRNSQPPVLNNHLSATSTFLSWETAHTLAIFIKHPYNNHLSTRGGSRIFFRRGCTHLGGGGGVHPLHLDPPLSTTVTATTKVCPQLPKQLLDNSHFFSVTDQTVKSGHKNLICMAHQCFIPATLSL